MDVVVRDEVSRMGLRQVHVMRPGLKAEEAREWAVEVMRGLLAQGGTVEAWMLYEDEGLGMWHLRAYVMPQSEPQITQITQMDA